MVMQTGFLKRICCEPACLALIDIYLPDAYQT